MAASVQPFPAPPPSLLAVVAEARDAVTLRRLLAQISLLVFIGASASGALWVTLVLPEAPLSKLWFWIFGFGAACCVVANLALQGVARLWPARRVRRAYGAYLEALSVAGREALAAACNKVLELALKDSSDSHQDLVPFAPAFDDLVVLLGQFLTIERGLVWHPGGDLETCVIEIERLRIHIDEDLLPDEDTRRMARRELVLRLEQAEVQAALTERILGLEQTIASALGDLGEHLRRSVGQRGAVMLSRRLEFQRWWVATKQSIAGEFRALIAELQGVT